jgi:hypothetical protein
MMVHDRVASVLHTAIAEEMRHIRVLLEQLAELLASDEDFAGKYLEQFQTFDLLIQCADESAAVLDRLADGAHSHDAIAPVRLAMVQDRLRQALDQAA